MTDDATYQWNVYDTDASNRLRLVEQFNEQVRLAKVELEFENHLRMNEMMYGSAYGPYLPIKEMTGLAGMLRDQIADQIFSESVFLKYLARDKRKQVIKDLYGDSQGRQKLLDAIEASSEGAVNAQSTNLSRQQAARLQQGKEEPDE
jgi:hypothetical protein